MANTFNRHYRKDEFDGREIATSVQIRFPKSKAVDAGFMVEAVMFTRDRKGEGEFRYVEIIPTMIQAGRVITDLSLSGEENWVNTLVYTDALDTWLKPGIINEEKTGWIYGGKAFVKYTEKLKQLGVNGLKGEVFE